MPSTSKVVVDDTKSHKLGDIESKYIEAEDKYFNYRYNQRQTEQTFDGICYIDIVITDLPVYKNFESKFNIKVPKTNFEDKICKYIFMRIFRMLFLIDFIHDFLSARDNNVLIKTGDTPKDKDIKKKIIDICKTQYNADKEDIRKHIFDKDEKKYDEYELDIIKEGTTNYTLKTLDEYIFKNTDENLKILLQYKILPFLGITQTDIELEAINPVNSFDKILPPDPVSNLKIMVDADKSRFSLYPIFLKLTQIYNNGNTIGNFKSIQLIKSIIDQYDGATKSALQKMMEKFENRIREKKPFLDGKIKVDKDVCKEIQITIKLGKDDTYSNRYIDITFKEETFGADKSKTYLTINRFFALDKPPGFYKQLGQITEKGISNGSLKNVSQEMLSLYNLSIQRPTDNDLKTNIMYFSYYKTMGDFSQVLLCYNKSIIVNSKSIYSFLSFDKIASYISSLFNRNTIMENDKNPFIPLSYFKYDWNDTSMDSTTQYLSGLQQYINNIRRYYWPNFSSLPTIFPSFLTNLSSNKRHRNSFGKQHLLKYKMLKDKKTKDRTSKDKKTKDRTSKDKKTKDRISKDKKTKNKDSKNDKIVKLAKKYRIKLDKNTITNLKKLLKLQVKAKKLRIKITKKIVNKSKEKRVYKTIKQLTIEIDNKLKVKTKKQSNKIKQKKNKVISK